jgi:phage-related protein
MNPSDQVIEHIIELLAKIEKKIDEISRLINAALSSIPAVFSYIVDKVRDGWNGMLGKLAEFWNWFTDKLTYAGNPFVLNGAAEAWRAMGGKIAKINDSITDLNLSVDDRWKGYAADQYEQSIEPQRRANTSIMSDFAENIASAMGNLAGAIIAFWVGVAVAIISLLSALAGAAVATGTIIGLPAAPVLIALGIAAFLIAAGGGVAILYVAAGGSRATLTSTSAGISQWPKIATQ